jgi:hypothetical protein
VTDAEVIAAIRQTHLKANIAGYEAQGATLHWDRAWVDPGGVIWGPGPYAKVPVTREGDEIVIRVYPPERLRRRLAKARQT